LLLRELLSNLLSHLLSLLLLLRTLLLLVSILLLLRELLSDLLGNLLLSDLLGDLLDGLLLGNLLGYFTCNFPGDLLLLATVLVLEVLLGGRDAKRTEEALGVVGDCEWARAGLSGDHLAESGVLVVQLLLVGV
jgi:hypothetical protein